MEERSRNQKIADGLADEFRVFLPQKDGLLLHDLVNRGVSISEAEKSVFKADTVAMQRADIILAVLDGATIDEGVAYEMGFCKALNKVCVGLQTDIRRQLPTGNNPMINQACEAIFDDFENLVIWLKANISKETTLTSSYTRTHCRSPVN
jgi:nucleoside 2-deoxyribosyltransferase